MKKKTFVLLMVCILALSMSAAAFAAGSSVIDIYALYKEPDIEVNVPTAGQFYLNPKSIPLIVDQKVNSSQIINTPWSIENRSKVAISVDAKVSAAINSSSSMYLSTKSFVNSKTRAKGAFIYLDMRVTDPGVNLESLDWEQTVYDGKSQLLVMSYERQFTNIMTLAPAAGNGSVSSGGVGAFRLCGDANANPFEEWNPNVDNMAVNITLTFRPTAPME